MVLSRKIETFFFEVLKNNRGYLGTVRANTVTTSSETLFGEYTARKTFSSTEPFLLIFTTEAYVTNWKTILLNYREIKGKGKYAWSLNI